MCKVRLFYVELMCVNAMSSEVTKASVCFCISAANVSLAARFTSNHQNRSPPCYHGNCAFSFFFSHVCCFPFSFYSSRRSLLYSVYCPSCLLFLVCLFISPCKPIVYALVHMHLYVLQASVYWMEDCSIARTLPYIQYDDHINSQSGYR